VATAADNALMAPSPVSSTTIAREVFAAVWALLILGAVRAALPGGVRLPIDLDGFVAGRKTILDRVHGDVRDVAKLPEEAMALFEEADWSPALAHCDALGPLLLLYARGRAAAPVDLEDQPAVTKLVAHGVDCQLVGLVDALARAAAERGAVQAATLPKLLDGIIGAAELAGASDPRASAQAAYRAWSATRLGDELTPDSKATVEGRAALREVADGLDALLTRDAS
jgi:hypothetical protein